MSNGLKKTALKALLPALLLAQPGLASVRSSSVSRSRPSRAAMATPQASAPAAAHAVGTDAVQANPFAAFGASPALQEVHQPEPAAETLALLEAEGLLQPSDARQATGPGSDLDGRKQFATVSGQASFAVDCDATGTNPAWATPPGRFFFRWRHGYQYCYISDRTKIPMTVTTRNGVANCDNLHRQCKAFAAPNAAPVNAVAPNVTGTAAVGNALSTTNGTWTDADGDTLTYSYQWYRADDASGTNLAAIASATTASRTLTTSDAHKYLRVVVTANDGNGGTQTATSAYTQVLNSAPVNSVVPSVSGTATVGNALSTTNGTWSDADGDSRSYTYQWYRADDAGGTNLTLLAGANSASYTLTTSDARKYLRVVVTANDGYGGVQAAASAFTAVGNSAPTDIALSGNSVDQSGGVNALVGTLSATDPDGGDTHTYTLVAGAGDTDNGSFNIAGASLRANDAAGLPAGSYSVRVRVADSGASTYEKTFAVTVVDDVAPAAPVILGGGGATASGTPTFTGTAEASSAVTVLLGGSTVIGVTTANGSGNWSVTVASALADGVYSVTATATDAAANSSAPSTAVSVTVDGTAPSVSSIAVSGTPAASATAVSFTVNFSEAVDNVSSDDFEITTTGDATGTVASVSGSGASYTVAVAGITGNGSIRLDLKAGTDIADIAGNATAAYSAGSTHTAAVPVVPGAPTIGTATVTGPGQVSVSFTPPASTGGATITGYTVTSSPGSITASGGGSPVTISGLTPGTSYTFTVYATNSAGDSAVSGASNSVTPAPALVAGAVSATVAYGSSGPIALAITGTPTSVAVASAPTHGTAVASGTGITYTPAAGYAGPDSFTYTASDAYSTSPAATVSLTVAAPTLTLGPSTLAPAQAGNAYQQALSVSGGHAPYRYAVSAGALPPGVSLSDGGVLSGTATAAGSFAFTVTATDSSTGSGPFTATGSYTLAVQAPAIELELADLSPATGSQDYRQPLTARGGTAPYRFALLSGTLPAGLRLAESGEITGAPTEAGSFAFTVQVTDAHGFTGTQAYTFVVVAPTLLITDLPSSIDGEDDGQSLSASGGTAPYRFTVQSGNLPPGLTLDPSGQIGGEPTAAGTFEFTVQVTDANGFSGTRAYRITVLALAQAIEAFVATPAAPVYTPGGTFAVDARGGASGQPVVFASASPSVCSVQGNTVTMLAAGTCTLTADQAGTALYQAAPQARLEVAIALAVPVITWIESLNKVYGEAAFDLADPASTSPGAFTFASADPAVATVSGRTVTLAGEGRTVITATQAASGSYAAGSVQVVLVVGARPDPTADRQVASAVQAQIDASVRFAQVQSGNIRDRLRQVRTGANASSFNVALAYAGNRGVPGMAVPLGRAANAAMPALPEGWGAWAAGTATFGKAGRRDGAGGGGFDFSTGGITVGADRALGEHALLGMAGSWGRQDTDFDGSPSKADADQRSLAVYGLWRAGEHVFLDAMLATGRLDFELTRWSELANAAGHGQRKGEQWFGSLTVGYEHRGSQGLTLTGYGRYDGHRADLDGYREHGLGVFDLAYGDQRVDTGALAVGLEGSHAFEGVRTRWRPFWSVEYRQALENRGDVAVNYVQRPAARDYQMALRSYNDDMLALGAGMDLQLDSGWMFSVLLGHEQGRNRLRSHSVGLQVRYGSQAGAAPVYVDENGLGYEDERCRGHGRSADCGRGGRGIQP